MRRLPPLIALRAFEAAGRHGTLSRAGEELSVTHGAISRHVRHLETWLGEALFHRRGARLTLTETGRRYLSEVIEILDRLEAVSTDISHHTSQRVLHVTAGITLTAAWLLPRLGRFLATHPGIEVRLNTSSIPLTALDRPFDVAIRGTPDAWPDLQSRAFMTERRVPAASPALAGRLCAAPSSEAALGNVRLLHAASIRDAWGRWSDRHGVALPRRAHGLVFDSMALAAEAAVQGLGLAMVSETLSAPLLADGRLVAPWPDLTLPESPFYWYRHRSASPASPAGLFCTWLEGEGAAC